MAHNFRSLARSAGATKIPDSLFHSSPDKSSRDLFESDPGSGMGKAMDGGDDVLNHGRGHNWARCGSIGVAEQGEGTKRDLLKPQVRIAVGRQLSLGTTLSRSQRRNGDPRN